MASMINGYLVVKQNNKQENVLEEEEKKLGAEIDI